MKGFRQHPFRVSFRLLWFGLEVVVSLFDFLFHCVFCSKASRRRARALWLQRTGKRVGRVLNLQIRSLGEIPHRGLLISNHVSYVDILVLVSLAPALFVAKREVKFWPVMGLLAQLGGTVFIDRQRRTHVGEVNDDIRNALDDGALVTIFPEGTSSDGRAVLPFRSPLLEPATRLDQPLTVARLQYTLADGSPDEEVAYWGDATFFPHLLNLLSRDRVQSTVRFGIVTEPVPDRKALALQLHSAVSALK